MSNSYIAKPPRFLGGGSRKEFLYQISLMARAGMRVLWQVLVPYNRRPEEPTSLPTTPADIDNAQFDQCQWIFHQAEERRDKLERKAQSAFSVIVFLVPLLASVFAFIFRQFSTDITLKWWEIVLLSASATMLLLGFVSVVRALLVHSRETLFLAAVIDLNNGNFIEYKRENHARGLLYCASMNTAMNDYIAQFVKGAQLLTALAVVIMSAAAVLIGVEFSRHPPSSIAQTQIVGPVEVNSTQLSVIENDIALLKKRDLSTERDRVDLDKRLTALRATLAELQSKIAILAKPRPARRTKP